jgi:alkylation response protein AidB-like acyl-CoA dehydrogenase
VSTQSAHLHVAVSAPAHAAEPRGLTAVARGLEPLIRASEEVIEKERRLPGELVDALYDAGFFRCFLPAELGGLDPDLLEWMDAIEELSRLNGSVGWNAFINAGQTALGPETMQRVLAETRWIAAGNVGRAGGRAVKVDGGYRVSGRWPFSSGADFATFLNGRSLVYDEAGEPVTVPEIGQAQVMACFPRDAATVHETWDGLGLRGTSSHDVEVDDLFVPDEFVGAGLFGPYAGPLFRTMGFILQGHCAHAVGVARCAIDAFVELVQRTQARPSHGSARQPLLGRYQPHRIAVARAESLVQSARLLAWDSARRAWEQAKEGREIEMELRVLLAQSMINAAHAAKEAVDLVFEAAGTSGVFRGGPIERCYRDIATAAQHTLVVETSYEAIGDYYLTRSLPEGPKIDAAYNVIMPSSPGPAGT